MLEVDSLKSKANEMLASGQQPQAAEQAQRIIAELEQLASQVRIILDEREAQYKDHRAYREAYDELGGWLARARERLPSLRQRPLGKSTLINNKNLFFLNRY